MVRVLAISDEVVESLWQPTVRSLEPDLVVACGDLPFDYLDYLVSTLNVPMAYVPGNHDPDVSGRRSRAGLSLEAGLPADETGPPGAVNVDGRIADVAGLRVAGLGGSIRYREGPNQYTERQQRGRARRLAVRARLRRLRDHRPVDLLLTHSPPAGVGDGEDAPHRGFACLHDLTGALRPRFLLHGHVHPYGREAPDRRLGETRVCNVVGHRMLQV